MPLEKARWRLNPGEDGFAPVMSTSTFDLT